MKKTVVATALNEQFNEACKVINLQYEYEGYDGEEKWAIVTELSKQDLLEKYPEIVGAYVPFVLLSVAQGEAIHIFNQNEDKFRKRKNNNEDVFGYDEGLTELFHLEVLSLDYWEEKDEEERKGLHDEMVAFIVKAVEDLKPIQRSRLKASFFDGKTTREIAEEEGVSHTAVVHSINAAIKNLKKSLRQGFQNAI